VSEPPPPTWQPRKTRDEQRKKKDVTLTFDPIDIDLLGWLAEYLGVSRSEAVRTAVRSFAGQMATLEKKRGRPRGGQ
jgi:hypothetical protein